MGVRGRFLVVWLVGVVVPIVMAGIWVARSATSAGERLLRTRLDESLGEAVNGIGERWVNRRSAILRLAEDPTVIRAMLSGHVIDRPDLARDAALRSAWLALIGVVDEVTFVDAAGAPRGTLVRAAADRSGTDAGTAPTLSVRIPIFDVESNTQAGSLDARVLVSALLPASTLVSAVAGSALALFDARSAAPLIVTSIAPSQFALDRFQWGGEEWIVQHRALDEPPLRLALAAPTGLFTQPFSQAAFRGSVALLIVLAGGSILALVLTRRITRPLASMAEASGAIARGDLVGRVDEEGPDEIRRLGRAFNAMAVSLGNTLRQLSQREAVAAVGEFAASLAHEVRNPLTSIRLDIERAREKLADRELSEELLDRAIHQVDRLDAAVIGTLRIARSGSLILTPLDIWQPLGAAMHAAAPAFVAHSTTIERANDLSNLHLVRGNADALEQLFLNVLLNAAEATKPGGRTTVAAENLSNSVCVIIRDDGSGIPAEQLVRVFEPFFTTRAEGTGLGLPIARRIARAHGGELTIESEPGHGTIVRISLPRDQLNGESP